MFIYRWKEFTKFSKLTYTKTGHVPDREISVLKSTQIPEESENLEFVVGSKKKRQMAYFLHQDHRNQNFSQLAYLNYNKIYTTAINKGMAFCSDNKF